MDEIKKQVDQYRIFFREKWARPVNKEDETLFNKDFNSLRRLISKEARNYRKHLKSLTESVANCLFALDVEMKKPSNIERGKRIAKICNVLEMANDQARYFGLSIDYRTDKKPLAKEAPDGS